MIRAAIIDDERLLRIGMKKILCENVREIDVVETFSDGIECLEYLENNDIDVIISDIRMPRMDGITLLKTLREREKKVDFFLVSGYDDFEYCRSAIQYGACDYLLKPIDKDELIRIMRHYAQNASGKQADAEDAHASNGAVRAIKQYLRAHYAERITMERLSGEFHMNANYISQLFKKETDMSVTDYLLRIRMEMAKALLRDTQNRIMEVAERVGYTDPKQFSTAFRKYYQLTPSEFREQDH